MFNITTGKINLKPNEIKTVNMPRGKYKKTPVVFLTDNKGNNSFTLEKVNTRYFIVSNDSYDNITINYVINNSDINNSKNIVDQEPPIEYSITGTDATINYYHAPDNSDLISIDFENYFSYTEDATVSYSVTSATSSETPAANIDTGMMFIVGSVLDLNPDTYSFYGDVIITTTGVLNEDNNVSDTAEIRINFVDLLYSTSNSVSINYNSPSSLDSYLGYHITYTATSGESTSSFVLPTLSQNNSENYFKFTSNISSSPSMSLYLLSNDVSVYFTSNPDNPLQNRTIVGDLGNYANYNYEMLLEDQTDYYFWYDDVDLTWYYSTERFPVDVNS